MHIEIKIAVYDSPLEKYKPDQERIQIALNEAVEEALVGSVTMLQMPDITISITETN